MHCDRASELISARIDHELIFENEALTDHLRDCAACRDELDGMRRLDEYLRLGFAPERDAAETLVDKVKARLQARGRPVRRCSVLVVDDQPDLLLMLRAFLGEEFEVETAISGQEAQEWFARRDFDILLTDQRMPGMNGVEVLEWALRHHPRTQRLLMTGYSDLKEAIDAVNRGHIFRYVLKPWNNEALLNDLRASARVQQLEHDYQRVMRELNDLNAQLEERVRVRTRELEESNRELERRSQTLEKFALTDALTQLPNRFAICHLAERELFMCKRFPAPLTVGMLDVDCFKAINTKYHHPGGDQVLSDLAKCMTAALRRIDALGRLGGDEFMLVAPQTNLPGGNALAERLRARVEHFPFSYQGEAIPVTVSIGLAVLEAGQNATFEQLKKAAAAALARAKINGRNCVEIELVTAATEKPRPGAEGVASA
jgi:diguanylate cyclase (GGDEF)-like protein